MTRDGSMLVASSRPPSPASITADLDPGRGEGDEGGRGAASNWVTDSPSSSVRLTTSTACATRSTAAANASGSISAPRIRIRSRQRSSWGER